MAKDRNTEHDIIVAARETFHEKGYKEATMRDIAAKANVNMAILHYYFKSKDNLFTIVLDEAFRMLLVKIEIILKNDEIDIFDKITAIVNEYVEYFIDEPYLPKFLLSEAIRNPGWIGERMMKNERFLAVFRVFSDQLEKEHEKGTIRQISSFSLLLNITSLCIFPAVISPMICKVSADNSKLINLMMDNRRNEVADFIIKAIKN